MRYFSSCDQWKLWPLLAAAIACLASTGASASVAVTYYIVVQPIDVCFTVNRTTTCPQVNNLQPPAGFTYQSALSNPSTTSIGFFDATTGKDLTRVMLNQIGVDITWQPLARFNSGTDNTGWCRSSPSCAVTDWSHLHVLSTSTNPAPCTFTAASGFISCDFLTLSQQPSISKGTVPSRTMPSGVPVSSNVTTINMFFAEQLIAVDQTGVLYGFSWINNNGVAISQDAFSPPSVITPRLDTLGHELGHNFALTHNDFGAGTSASNTALELANLMTAGCCTSNGADLRTEPSSTGCSSPTQSPPNGGAVYDIDTLQCNTTDPTSPIAENLTLGTCSSLTGCLNQQGAIAGPNNGLPLSGFLNPIPTQSVTASPTSTCKKNCGTAPTSGPSPFDTINSNCSITFDVNYPGPSSLGRLGEYTVEMILTPPAGFTLINNTFQPVTKGFVSTAKIVNGQLIIVMSPPPKQFPPNQLTAADFQFIQGISKNTSPPCNYGVDELDSDTLADQDRMHFGWIFSDGYFVTSTFSLRRANSTNPDPAIPAQIVNPNVFVGFGALGCTTTTTCPKPADTGIEDGDVNTEGGQPPT